MMNNIFEYLDNLFPNPKCELIYHNDFEFLIAVVLSAQTTDKKVNIVTKKLFDKYDVKTLKDAPIDELNYILKPLGMCSKKSIYIRDISKQLCEKYNGIVPNNISDLSSLPGVGRKTSCLVLSALYNQPYFAVDTHITRVLNRLGIVNTNNPIKIEKEMYSIIPKDRINKTHHQLVLFGRYYCKSKKPECLNCKLKDICKNES